MTTLREGYIPLTPEMLMELTGLRDQTGYGGEALFNWGKAKGLWMFVEKSSKGLITAWLDGKVNSVNQEQWKEVIATYQAIPKAHYNKAKHLNARYNEDIIPDIFREKLQDLCDNPPNIGVSNLLKRNKPPRGLNQQKIRLLAYGKQDNVTPEQIKYLSDLLAFIGR